MKLLKGGLLLAALAIAMPTAKAEFVFDDFVGPGASDTGNADITRTVTDTGSIFVVGGGTANIVGFTPGAGSFTVLSYDASPAVATGILGFDRWLQFADLDVAGDWTLDIGYTGDGIGGGGVASGPSSLSPIALTSADNGNFLVDLSQVYSPDNLNNLTNLMLTFTADGAAASGPTQISFSQIAGVPEPTSIALLGLTGLGGIVVARRRRKVQKEA